MINYCSLVWCDGGAGFTRMPGMDEAVLNNPKVGVARCIGLDNETVG